MNPQTAISKAPLAGQYSIARDYNEGRRSSAKLRVSQAFIKWTLIAFVVRFLAALVIHGYSLSIGRGGLYPLGLSDDLAYWTFSRDIYNGITAPSSGNVYPFVLAAFYHLVGGPNLLLGQMLNVVAGALTVGVAVLLVQELTRDNPSRAAKRRSVNWAGTLLTVYPSLLWYSTQLLKDAILILLGLIALYCQVLFLKRARLGPIFGWILCLLGMFFFRPYAVAAIVFSLGLFVLRFNRKWFVPVLLFMAFAPYAMGSGIFGLNLIGPMIATENIATFRQQGYSVGGSSAGITIDYSTPVGFLTTFSYSFATAMFGPFPWQIRAAAQAVALPEAMGMWFLIPLWLRAMWDLFQPKRSDDRYGPRDVSLLLFSFVLAALISLFSDNIGANTRLRLLAWSAFLIFAAIRLGQKRWKLL